MTGRALLEAMLGGAVAGAVGVHVVLRRLPFFAMTVSHGTFPGVVVASLAGTSLLLGGWAFALAIVLVTAALGTVGRIDDNSAVGVVLAGSFGLGALLISTQPGFTKDLAAFLVGSIVTVTAADVVATATVGAAVLLVLGMMHKEIVFGAFDRTGAAAAGYSTTRIDVVVLLCVAATVVTLVPAVGVILAVALLVTPAATARLWCDRLVPTILVSAAIGGLSGAAGLAVSRQWDVAAGASIVLVASAGFAVSLVLTRVRRRGPRGTSPGRRRPRSPRGAPGARKRERGPAGRSVS